MGPILLNSLWEKSRAEAHPRNRVRVSKGGVDKFYSGPDRQSRGGFFRFAMGGDLEPITGAEGKDFNQKMVKEGVDSSILLDCLDNLSGRDMKIQVCLPH